jgi:hypothetical protein
MSKSAKIDLGEFKDENYFLYVEAEPDWNNPEKFVATVYYRKLNPETMEEEKIEVVRIENKAHGFCHMDKLFEKGEPKEEKDMTLYEAWQHLEQKWEKYARRYQNK